MLEHKVGRAAELVKEVYLPIESCVRPAGTFALVKRTRRSQGVDLGVAYAIVGLRGPLPLKKGELGRLVAADQAGEFRVLLRSPEAWFSCPSLARQILSRLIEKGRIPSREEIEKRAKTKRNRYKRRQEGVR